MVDTSFYIIIKCWEMSSDNNCLSLADRGFWSYLLKVFFAESDKKNYSPLESSEAPSLPSSFVKDSFKLIFCSAGLLSSYLIWGLLQERIMTQVHLNINQR